MHPNSGQIDANDETFRIIDDEELVDREELDERGDHDATANQGTDENSVGNNVQYNRSTQPRHTNFRATEYTFRSSRRKQRFPHQRPRRGRTTRTETMGLNTALLHSCVSHCPDSENARPTSITDTPDYRKIV
jgi:hypothetical protein